MGQVKSGSTLHLADIAQRDRMELRLLPRIGPDRRIEVVLGGTLNVGGVARPVAASVSLVPGQAKRVLTLGSERRAVRVWLKAELLGPTARQSQPASPGL